MNDRARPTSHEKDIVLTKEREHTMNKQTKGQVLSHNVVRDVELGGVNVAQYGITCKYAWHDDKKFTLQIGDMPGTVVKGIEADYFWGFVDKFNARTMIGVLYAIFSKGDELLVYEFVNNGNYSNHRTFVMNATSFTQKTHIGSKKGHWFRFHKPHPDSFNRAYIATSDAYAGKADDSSWDVRFFPETAYAGKFAQLPIKFNNQPALFKFWEAEDGRGLLTLSEKGQEDTRLLHAGKGIVFDGIYRTGNPVSGQCVAVFVYGDGQKIHVYHNAFATDRPEVRVFMKDLADSLYSQSTIRADELWLDEDGRLCAPMSDPKPNPDAYWRYEEDNGGWNLYDPEEEASFAMEQEFAQRGLWTTRNPDGSVTLSGLDKQGNRQTCTLMKDVNNHWRVAPVAGRLFANATLGSITTRKINVLAKGVLDIWNTHQEAITCNPIL